MRYFLIMSICLFMLGCSNEKPDRNYFIGIWKANDGAKIEFYINGKCKASGLNHYSIHPFEKYKNQILNFEGNWTFENDKLHLSYPQGETKQTTSGFDLLITGQGLLENTPPWDLYLFLGDPDDIDDSNKYIFIKQE